MTAPPAWVHTQERGDHLWVLELGGELDMDTAGQLRVSLLAVPAVHLVVDLSAVRFCGAAGVTLLLELRDHVETTGHQLQLMVPPRRARSLRFLLDEHLLASHRPTVAEAITALPSRALDGATRTDSLPLDGRSPRACTEPVAVADETATPQ